MIHPSLNRKQTIFGIWKLCSISMKFIRPLDIKLQLVILYFLEDTKYFRKQTDARLDLSMNSAQNMIFQTNSTQPPTNFLKICSTHTIHSKFHRDIRQQSFILQTQNSVSIPENDITALSPPYTLCVCMSVLYMSYLMHNLAIYTPTLTNQHIHILCQILNQTKLQQLPSQVKCYYYLISPSLISSSTNINILQSIYITYILSISSYHHHTSTQQRISSSKNDKLLSTSKKTTRFIFLNPTQLPRIYIQYLHE
jgi:hypothetical protein